VAVYAYMKIGEVAYPHIVKKAAANARQEIHNSARKGEFHACSIVFQTAPRYAAASPSKSGQAEPGE
jgi:hypothetical protein